MSRRTRRAIEAGALTTLVVLAFTALATAVAWVDPGTWETDRVAIGFTAFAFALGFVCGVFAWLND